MTLFETGPKPAPKQAAVAKALRDHPATMSPDDIARATGLERSEVANALTRLHTALRVQRIGDGYWEITKGGIAWLAMQEARNG